MLTDRKNVITNKKVHIIIIGDHNVGKTSIIQKYESIENENRCFVHGTFGKDFVLENFTSADDISVKIKIWDRPSTFKYVPDY